MSIVTAKSRRVKPSRRTGRPAAPFGTGVYPTRTRFEPTEDDRRWAAQVFGEIEDDRQLEERALQAQWDDQFVGTIPVGYCRSCGEPAEVNGDRLCLECEAIADRLATPY
jgi:hypothetical protein